MRKLWVGVQSKRCGSFRDRNYSRFATGYKLPVRTERMAEMIRISRPERTLHRGLQKTGVPSMIQFSPHGGHTDTAVYEAWRERPWGSGKDMDMQHQIGENMTTTVSYQWNHLPRELSIRV